MRSRGLYILSLDEPGYAEKTRASYEEAYALAKEIGDKRAMCQALIPTSWFTDYWQDYRDQAIANNDEARALAAELGDEELEIEAASARLRLLTLGEAHEEALRLRQRLEARRDPLRLKEHLFWLMWHYWLRADFEQCVATCDEGIALAAQLGSPPVQYASIKGLALTDLGRFDEAWASFQAGGGGRRPPLRTLHARVRRRRLARGARRARPRRGGRQGGVGGRPGGCRAPGCSAAWSTC